MRERQWQKVATLSRRCMVERTPRIVALCDNVEIVVVPHPILRGQGEITPSSPQERSAVTRGASGRRRHDGRLGQLTSSSLSISTFAPASRAYSDNAYQDVEKTV